MTEPREQPDERRCVVKGCRHTCREFVMSDFGPMCHDCLRPQMAEIKHRFRQKLKERAELN